MTSYVKSTNFASKDSLASGNPLKIIKGTEFDIEFNNIATAIDSKADTTSPVFAGTPTAPTAASGTNTTQLATTAFVTAALQAVYPVGSIYINAGATANPATLLGFGTWVAFGAGRVMVGLNGADPLFDALEETGGSKDAVIVAHSHAMGAAGAASGTFEVERRDNGVDSVRRTGGIASAYGGASVGGSSLQGSGNDRGTSGVTLSIPAHTHSIDAAGSSGTNANLQPYVTVAMWKRTA